MSSSQAYMQRRGSCTIEPVKKQERHPAVSPGCLPGTHFPKVVSLNVGGHSFQTRHSTLLKDKDSMLAAMFSGRHHVDKDSDGRYFIDRDGTYFGYILNFLRNTKDLPPANLAVQVYKEAQYYQIQTLTDKLEKYSNVFSLKLQEAKKQKLGSFVNEWKNTLITCAQAKSLQELSVTGRVNFLTEQEHSKIIDSEECLAAHGHHMVVTSPCRDSEGYNVHQESCSYVFNRLKDPDIIITDIPTANMDLFMEIMKRELRNDGYTCDIWMENIKCKNYKLNYGIGRDECKFSVKEYFVEFEWPETDAINVGYLSFTTDDSAMTLFKTKSKSNISLRNS